MVFRYDPPDDTIIGIKPGLVTYYFPTLKKAKRIHLSTGTDTSQWMSFGLGPINDIGALKDAAAVTVSEANGVTVLTFAPKDTKGAIKEISVSMSKDYTPLKIRIAREKWGFYPHRVYRTAGEPPGE